MDCSTIYEEFMKSSKNRLCLAKLENYGKSPISNEIKYFYKKSYREENGEEISCSDNKLKEIKSKANKSNQTINIRKYIIEEYDGDSTLVTKYELVNK